MVHRSGYLEVVVPPKILGTGPTELVGGVERACLTTAPGGEGERERDFVVRGHGLPTASHRVEEGGRRGYRHRGQEGTN